MSTLRMEVAHSSESSVFIYQSVWHHIPEGSYNVLCGIHDHPFYHVCPDILSLVCDPLSGNGYGSPNHTQS